MKTEKTLYDYDWCKGNIVLPKEKATLKLPSLPYEYDPLINKNQETLEEASEKMIKEHPDFEIEGFSEYQNGRFNGITEGAKWKQEQICKSEVIQKIRNSKSDAEARRIIRTL